MLSTLLAPGVQLTKLDNVCHAFPHSQERRGSFVIVIICVAGSLKKSIAKPKPSAIATTTVNKRNL